MLQITRPDIWQPITAEPKILSCGDGMVYTDNDGRAGWPTMMAKANYKLPVEPGDVHVEPPKP